MTTRPEIRTDEAAQRRQESEARFTSTIAADIIEPQKGSPMPEGSVDEE